MNKRQRKKHGGTKIRRRHTVCAVTESCGNVFRDLGLPDPERTLEDAARTSARDPKSRRVDRRIDRIRESQG